MPLWYYEVNTRFDAEHPALFYFGTSEKDAYVLMDVFSGNKHLESKLLHLSDSLVRFEYPYREAYGNGLGITFAFVRKGIVYEPGSKSDKAFARLYFEYTLGCIP